MTLDRIPSHHSDSSEGFESLGDASRTARHDDTMEEEPLEDNEKKLGLKTTYEGFSIWGWVLCLLVERKGGPTKKGAGPDAQALMEEWITSTQQQQDDD